MKIEEKVFRAGVLIGALLEVLRHPVLAWRRIREIYVVIRRLVVRK